MDSKDLHRGKRQKFCQEPNQLPTFPNQYSFPEKFCTILALENVVQNFSGKLYISSDALSSQNLTHQF